MQLGKLSKKLIDIAIEEDLGTGDITTIPIVPKNINAIGRIIAKGNFIICGQKIAEYVFSAVDPNLSFQTKVLDGESVRTGSTLAEISGCFASILQGERIALNFLQRLSGIATKTARIVDLVKGTGVKILDTRKTTPGLREFEKYAVRVGGGYNHRFGLYDQILIKNNHIDVCNGDIVGAITKAREYAPKGTRLEIEVRSIEELQKALVGMPDAILLDNMSPELVKQAVNVVKNSSLVKSIELEASGGINDSNIRKYAETGVDYISLGALTHSVMSEDISLRYAAG